jgi:Co/Zn/Cd efflux system component
VTRPPFTKERLAHPRQERVVGVELPPELSRRRYIGSLWLITLVALTLCAGEVICGYLASSDVLLADGAAWIYDVGIYGLAALSFGRAKSVEQRAAFALAAILGIGGFHGAYEIWNAIADPTHDKADNLTITAIIDIVGSFAEAALLFRFRVSHDPVVEATWLSARNSVLTSTVGAAVTLIFQTISVQWPQIVVDAFGVFLVFQAAVVVIRDAKAGRW